MLTFMEERDLATQLQNEFNHLVLDRRAALRELDMNQGELERTLWMKNPDADNVIRLYSFLKKKVAEQGGEVVPFSRMETLIEKVQ